MNRLSTDSPTGMGGECQEDGLDLLHRSRLGCDATGFFVFKPIGIDFVSRTFYVCTMVLRLFSLSRPLSDPTRCCYST